MIERTENMRIPKQDQWRYQGLAEAVAQMLRQDGDLLVDGVLEDIILNAMDKAYAMGRENPVEIVPAIPVTDLSDIPEFAQCARNRIGQCH